MTSKSIATDVKITDDSLTVTLSDGRDLSVPISWYPRLSRAKQEDREIWEFNGGGHGIYWSEIDEDISVENLIFGQPSGESASSFSRWKEWYDNKA
ncbi:MAG: DUF2442 domain-containing protein [Planctomycetes bacterium]|nr:DUF2442 domain-containing protein [Planctomycetota bacterium]